MGAVCLIAAVFMKDLSSFAVSVTCFAALAVFLLSVIFISPKSKYFCAVFLSFAVAAVSVSMLFTVKEYASVTEYDGKNAYFTGTVTKCNYNSTHEKLEIKIKTLNGEKHSFYIAVYSDTATGLCVGDKISAKAALSLAGGDAESENKNSSLADKIYFTAYGLENCSVCGENLLYKFVGNVKNEYKSVIENYLPNDLGAVILGMTVGERDGIGTYLRNCFNYSGTSHLLVVSGLHLTLWTALISEVFVDLRKNKRLNTAVTAVFIAFYLLLTGFSVSVIRAGLMILTVKAAKLFGRESDNLNSIGLSVAFLMILNPFSVISVSFLLSMGSTLGLILFSGKIHDFIYKSKIGRKITKYFLGRLIADSLAVSISVSVFTLPVFILFFDMFPTLSFLANIFIIDLAGILMLLSVLGTILHLLTFFPLAKFLFLIAGADAKAIIFIAEKIGMLRHSTVAVTSEYFKIFLIFAIVISLIFFLLSKKFKRIKRTFLPVALAVGFAFSAVMSENFEYAHPSVDVFFNKDCACVLVRDGYDGVFLGTENKNTVYTVGNMLQLHNLKTIGCLYLTETDAQTYSEIKNIASSYPAESLAFKEEKIKFTDSVKYTENVNSVTLNGCISVEPISAKTVIVTAGNKNIFISCDNSEIKLLENGTKYDIIILSTDVFKIYGEKAKKYLKNENSQIIALANEQITLYPDIGKICYSEN